MSIAVKMTPWQASASYPGGPIHTETGARNSAPTVTTVSPTGDDGSGGTTVTLTGTNYNAIKRVEFGGVEQPFTRVSATSITVTTLPIEFEEEETERVVSVVVYNGDGNTGTKASAFTYTAP